jgi:hypothetical protein
VDALVRVHAGRHRARARAGAGLCARSVASRAVHAGTSAQAATANRD